MWHELRRAARRKTFLLPALLALAASVALCASEAEAGGSGSTSGVLPYAATRFAGQHFALQLAAAGTIGAGGIHRTHP